MARRQTIRAAGITRGAIISATAEDSSPAHAGRRAGPNWSAAGAEPDRKPSHTGKSVDG